MKIWIKILIGIILGIIFALVIPANIGSMFFDYIAKIFINVGRYVIFPLVFFSLIIGTFELRLERNIMKTYGYILLYMVGAAIILVIIGVVSALVFSSAKINLYTETNPTPINVPGNQETFLMVFPGNLFESLVTNGSFLLPIIMLAFILGTNLTFDKVMTKPIVQFIDTLSRLFYHINSLIAEVYAVAIIAITSSTVIKLLSVSHTEAYNEFIIILVIDLGIIVFGVFPLLFYFLSDRKNPYKYLYAMTAPILTALATGDVYIPITQLVKHSKENLSIPRTIGSSVYPIFSQFGKCGSALVSSIAFIIILKSFKSNYDVFNVFEVMGLSFLVSFTLGSVPGLGAYAAIALLCKSYGNGVYENQYLNFEQIAPLIISVGAVIDVTASAFTSFLIAHQRGIKSKIEAQDFI